MTRDPGAPRFGAEGLVRPAITPDPSGTCAPCPGSQITPADRVSGLTMRFVWLCRQPRRGSIAAWAAALTVELAESCRMAVEASATRAARPSRHVPANNGALRPKAPTPTLPTPAIARPTVWAASQMSYEEVLDAVRDLELANGTTSPKQVRSQVLFAETLLGWLLRFPGESWQQRWHTSGADAAGKDWTALAAEPDEADPRHASCSLINRCT